MNDIFRRLRRNSKDSVEVSPPFRPREDSGVTLTPSEQSTPARLNFFDLPAELRNHIYEWVISDTTLSLPSSVFAPSKRPKLPLKRRKSLPTPINGLLLASQQCRREYLAVLLSNVSVVVEVKDFDFEGLMRVSSTLRGLEAKALQTNPNLRVHLVTQNCTTRDLLQLKRWLDHRKYDEVNLPWKYEFPLDKLQPPTTMGKVRLLRELEYYADTVATLAVDVAEAQQAELRSIIEAFESQAMELEDSLGWLGERNKSAVRNLRGLAGGGVH